MSFKKLNRHVTGIILAGGMSTRYGADKALAEIRGVPLVERVVRVMAAIFRHVILITNTPKRYDFLNLPMHEDLVKGLGPLGGIYTGLKLMEGRAGFVTACDMPFLSADLVRHMVGVQENFDAVVPKMDWKSLSCMAWAAGRPLVTQGFSPCCVRCPMPWLPNAACRLA